MPSPAVIRGARKRPLLNRQTTRPRRFLQLVLLFAASALATNAVLGERGLIDWVQNRRQYRSLTREIQSLRHENVKLRFVVFRLTEDPTAIEEVARQDLGLIRPGEQVFLINDYVEPLR